MRNIHFVPECFAETELVKSIIDNGDYLNHAEGIHNVSRILKMNDVQNYANIGFIDNDKKNLPPYFDEFVTLDENDQLIFKKHPKTYDYLIVSKPAIERFLLSQLNELTKNPKDYNLPEDFRLFKKTLKSMRIQYHEGFKSLIKDLRTANTAGILFIISKISELRKQ